MFDDTSSTLDVGGRRGRMGVRGKMGRLAGVAGGAQGSGISSDPSSWCSLTVVGSQERGNRGVSIVDIAEAWQFPIP